MNARSSTPSAEAVPIVPTGYIWRDPSRIPPREWLYDRHYVRDYVTATVAAPGVGKTSLALAEALAMVTGKPLLDVPVRKPLRIWYWNGEDPLDEIERRVAALCLHYQLRPDDLGGRLYFDSGRNIPIIVGEIVKNSPQIDKAVVDALAGECIAKKIDLLMLDPLVSAHKVPESDNGSMDYIVKAAFGAVAERANIGVDLQVHVRKGPAGTSNDYTVDDARGASAQIGAYRSVRVLNRMAAQERDQLGIAADEAQLTFRVDMGKQNMQRPSSTAIWRKLVSVPLGNATPDRPEDIVQVAVAWKAPDVMAGIVPDDVRKVQEAISAREYAANPQANDWAGHAIAAALGLKTDTKPEKAKVNALMRAWLKSGALATTRTHDTRNGRDRPIIVAGSAAA
jgi:hypothetical protein